MLQKEAMAIAKKLDAQVKQGGDHEQALIYHGGYLIARYGIRRDKKAKHGHIPKQIFLSENETLKLASCQISKGEYFEIVKKKGMLPTK